MMSARTILGWYAVLGIVGVLSQDVAEVQLDAVGEAVQPAPLRSPDAEEALEYLEGLSEGLVLLTHGLPVHFEELRSLQEVTPLNVALTCSSYNDDPSGLYNCSCVRQGRFDVRAECDIDQRLWNSDNTTYWKQRFTVTLNGAAAVGKETLPASVMITCTTQFDRGLPFNGGYDYYPSHETCVEIQPRTPGLFNESVLCGASVDGRLCGGCAQCGETLPNETKITVDCCNVLAEGKATCNMVRQSTGLTFTLWDPQGTHKGCNGSGAGSIASTTGLIIALVAGLGMLFL